MSKSLGNFITIQEILKKHSAEALRLLMLQTHYRSPLEYSEELIEAAERAIHTFIILKKRLELVKDKKEDAFLTFGILKNAREDIDASMKNDFNTPQALGAVYIRFKVIEQLANEKKLGARDYSAFCDFLNHLEALFGIIPPEKPVPKEIKKVASDREKLRAEKKWKEADALRKHISEKGFIVDDTPEGTIVIRLPRA